MFFRKPFSQEEIHDLLWDAVNDVCPIAVQNKNIRTRAMSDEEFMLELQVELDQEAWAIKLEQLRRIDFDAMLMAVARKLIAYPFYKWKAEFPALHSSIIKCAPEYATTALSDKKYEKLIHEDQRLHMSNLECDPKLKTFLAETAVDPEKTEAFYLTAVVDVLRGYDGGYGIAGFMPMGYLYAIQPTDTPIWKSKITGRHVKPMIVSH